jgi:Ca2+-binding RTX toxin-like protein
MIGDAQGDTYASIENVRGSAYVDWLVGNDGDNELRGNGGDDMIAGGIGADVLDGGEGIDLVSYYDSAAGVSIDLNENEASGGYATGDTISGFEGVIGSEHIDVLMGSNEGNVLHGLGGGDLIDGDDGEDVIDGGMGDDTLIGGAHADTFSFYGSSWQSDGFDTIVDFSVGVDRIEFRGTIDSIDDLEIAQFGAHTLIFYGPASDQGVIGMFGVDANQLLAQAESTFLFV